MVRRFSPAGVGVALALAAVGCGERVTPVGGVVRLDGKPIEEGTVLTFVPEGDTPMASARCGPDGRFRLEDVEQLGGLLPGTYKVVVTNSHNYVPVPWNASPDNPLDPVWDAYQKKLEEFRNRPPQPGMLPVEYGGADTTPLRYKAPDDGSEVVFDIAAVPPAAGPARKR